MRSRNASPADAAEQPGDQRRAQVADVQRTRRRRRKSTRHRRQCAECLRAARRRPIGSTACSATSAEPHVRPEHKFCMECGARLRRPTSDLALAPPATESEDPIDCRRCPPRRATRCSIRRPGSCWPSPRRRHCRRRTRTPPTCSRRSGPRWDVAGFGPPDVSAQGPGRWDHPSDTGPLWPSEATRLRRRGGTGDDDAAAVPHRVRRRRSLRRHGTGAGHLRAVGRAGSRPVGGRRTADRTAGLPGQAAADHLHPRRGGRHRRHVRRRSSTSTARESATLDGAWKLNDFGTNLTVAGIVTAADDDPRGGRLVRRVPLGCRPRRRCRRGPRRVGRHCHRSG